VLSMGQASIASGKKKTKMVYAHEFLRRSEALSSFSHIFVWSQIRVVPFLIAIYCDASKFPYRDTFALVSAYIACSFRLHALVPGPVGRALQDTRDLLW